MKLMMLVRNTHTAAPICGVVAVSCDLNIFNQGLFWARLACCVNAVGLFTFSSQAPIGAEFGCTPNLICPA